MVVLAAVGLVLAHFSDHGLPTQDEISSCFSTARLITVKNDKNGKSITFTTYRYAVCILGGPNIVEKNFRKQPCFLRNFAQKSSKKHRIIAMEMKQP